MSSSLRIVRPPWSSIVFVCSKCTKRQDRGSFRRDLKRALKEHGNKNVRVVASTCLDVCPRHAITLAIAHDLGAVHPHLRVVDRQADIAALAQEIGAGLAGHLLSAR